ncbi:hypothetical protein NB231_02960 [Nitrococcus mobilis Nb-231]|uniref:Uncharacterized protein n=1 Tax=Nitrococcus mobilis Nb-231 TaxID=314278 RepID=A4BVD3_9GAMM|nr:hypothetical protein NB231_02960 [Nitrococcus mobilis Nb-231]
MQQAANNLYFANNLRMHQQEQTILKCLVLNNQDKFQRYFYFFQFAARL